MTSQKLGHQTDTSGILQEMIPCLSRPLEPAYIRRAAVNVAARSGKDGMNTMDPGYNCSTIPCFFRDSWQITAGPVRSRRSSGTTNAALIGRPGRIAS